MSAAAIVDLEVNQRADFQATIYVANSSANTTDLTDYIIESKFQELDTGNTTTTSFLVDSTFASNGEFNIALTASQTMILNPYLRYKYDVILIDPSTDFKIRLIEGTFKVSGGVT